MVGIPRGHWLPSALYHDPLDRVRFVRLVFQCSSQFRQKGDCPFFFFDGLEGDAVNPGAPLVGADKVVGMTVDVHPINLIVQSMEATGWCMLGLTVQLPLKYPDVFRGS